MDKLSNSLKTKAFKYGSLYSLLIAGLIIILILINIGAQKLNWRMDLTVNKLYSISEDTMDILDGLSEEITIYPVFVTGVQDSITDLIVEVLNSYTAYSNKIKVEYKDPQANPQFSMQYSQSGEALAGGSIVVTCGDKFKVIDPNDVVTAGINYETFQQEIQSIDIEPQISNSILYVSSKTTPVVYVTTGHEEPPLPEQLMKEISLANFELVEIDLVKASKIPDDCKLLLSVSPIMDFTDEEVEKTLEYLNNGGRGVFFVEVLEEPLKNFQKILNQYGVEASNAFLVEGDPNYFVQDYPLNILPEFEYSDAGQIMEQKVRALLTPNAQAILELEDYSDDLLIEHIAVTTEKSYAKTTENIMSIGKEEGDTDGPFTVCAAITNESNDSRVVVIGNSFLLNESVNSFVGGGNYKFVVNAMNWTQNKESAVYIAPKTYNMEYLYLSQANALLLSLFSVILLPLGIFGFGLSVWYKRKRR